jgi:hypothetical protein
VVALYAATEAMRSRTRNANVPFMMLLESDYENVFFDRMHPGEGYEATIIYTIGASLSNWFNIYKPIQAVEIPGACIRPAGP